MTRHKRPHSALRRKVSIYEGAGRTVSQYRPPRHGLELNPLPSPVYHAPMKRTPVLGFTALVAGIMLAIGRIPNTENMGLEGVGVELGQTGAIKVDKYSRTNIDNIWAIGDVTNRVQLTPVAIHEAMCFIETAFKGNPRGRKTTGT